MNSKYIPDLLVVQLVLNLHHKNYYSFKHQTCTINIQLKIYKNFDYSFKLSIFFLRKIQKN